MCVSFSVPKNLKGGWPHKVDPQALEAIVRRYAGSVTNRATAPDAVVAEAASGQLGVSICAETVRLMRKKLGIAAYPKGGARPGAGRKPRGPNLKPYRPKPVRKPRAFRKLTCSRESLVAWNAQEYQFAQSCRRYVYVGTGARPRDLPRSLPRWGAGNGSPVG